jgi:hypothetical protein
MLEAATKGHIYTGLMQKRRFIYFKYTALMRRLRERGFNVHEILAIAEYAPDPDVFKDHYPYWTGIQRLYELVKETSGRVLIVVEAEMGMGQSRLARKMGEGIPLGLGTQEVVVCDEDAGNGSNIHHLVARFKRDIERNRKLTVYDGHFFNNIFGAARHLLRNIRIITVKVRYIGHTLQNGRTVYFCSDHKWREPVSESSQVAPSMFVEALEIKT